MLNNAIRLILVSGVILTAAPCLAGESVFGVTSEGFLINWNSATPGTIISGKPIQGLQANESLVGIDFRPATGELFGLGSFSRLYRLNPATGFATAVGGQFNPLLNGAAYGFDVNPVADRLRIVSDADQNLRANPITGAIAAVDPNLFYAAGDVNQGVNPNVSHVAYTNSVPNPVSTTLYGLDAGTDSLVLHQVGPGFAQLTTIGSVGTDITDDGGFDISGVTGVPYAVVRDIGLSASMFWTIDLATGNGSFVGQIGGGHFVTALAVVPEPSSLALLSLAGLAGLVRRR